MKFDITLDEVQTLATFLIKHYKKSKHKVVIEKSVHVDAPRRTTIIAEKNGEKRLIECQNSVNYEVVKQLVQWLAANRLNCELYIATDGEAHISGGALTALRKEGIGLIVLEDKVLSTPMEAKNFALIVNLSPSLKLGQFVSSINKIISEFNKGNNSNRKAALREMCELVEGETDKLLLKGIKKGIIIGINETKAQSMEWNDQINYLARKESYAKGKPLFDENLKLDFQSFRGARNLVDHKVRNKKEEANRQIQYVERMHQGPRLVSVLLSLYRKI